MSLASYIYTIMYTMLYIYIYIYIVYTIMYTMCPPGQYNTIQYNKDLSNPYCIVLLKKAETAETSSKV